MTTQISKDVWQDVCAACGADLEAEGKVVNGIIDTVVITSSETPPVGDFAYIVAEPEVVDTPVVDTPGA